MAFVRPSDHQHVFKDKTRTVALRRVTQEGGKTILDTISGRDILKQRECACGEIETYDLERVKA